MGSRKFVAFILTLILIIGIVPTNSVADGDPGVIFEAIAPEYVSLGQVFEVQYRISTTDAGGIAGFSIELAYDPNCFNYVSHTNVIPTGFNDDADYNPSSRILQMYRSGNATLSSYVLILRFEAAKAFSGEKSFGFATATSSRIPDSDVFCETVSDTVSMYSSPTSLSISPASLTMQMSTSSNLRAIIVPEYANGTFEWASSEPSIVGVVGNGRNATITSSEASGIATITCTLTDSIANPPIVLTATSLVTVSPGIKNTVLSISPSDNAVVDDDLTATLTNITSQDSVSYQWYRIVDSMPILIDGATNQTYTVQEVDVGKQLTVRATIKDVSTGIKYSNSPVSTTDAVSINKATQATPTNFSVSTKTDITATLTATNGIGALGALEYGYATASDNPTEPVATQSNVLITGLKEYTEYVFFARHAETTTHSASPWATCTATTLFTDRAVTTAKAPDVEQITVAATPTSNVHTGDTVTVTTTNADESKYQFYKWVISPTNGAQIKSTTTNNIVFTMTNVAETVEVTAKYREILAATNVTGTSTDLHSTTHKPYISYNAVEGQLYLVTTSDAAPTTGNAGWSDAASFTDLDYGTAYYIYTYKHAEANDEDFVSSPVTRSDAITTPHYYAWTTEPSPTNVHFTVRTGGSKPAAQTVTIKNLGSTNITGASVSLVEGSSGVGIPTLSADSIVKEGSITLTITPTGDTTTAKRYVATATVAAPSMTNIVIPIVYDVVDKTVVFISGEKTTEHTYDKTMFCPLPNLTATYTDGGPSKTFTTTNLVYTYYTRSNATPLSGTPTSAGSYTLKITVDNAHDADFIVDETTGNIDFEITKKTITATNLSVEDKVYDGTSKATLTSSGAGLDGVINGDDVTATWPTVGTFTNVNKGDDITVTIPDITLTGADAGNYTLTQPTLTGKITPKPITIIATASDKVYDGTNKATISLSFATGALVGEDTVTISTQSDALFETNGGIAGKNVGTNKAVNIGTISITGANAGNYTISQPTAPHATITQLEVDVTITGTTPQTYTNAPATPFTGTYTVADGSGDTAAVTVYYKLSGTDNTPSTTVPTLAGTYDVTASITDNNYKLGSTTDATTLVINKGTLSGNDVNVGVASLQTSVVRVPVSSFNINPAVAGTYAVTASTTNNNILKVSSSAPQVVGSNVEFYIQPGEIKDTPDTITVTFTPSVENTYEAKELKINVTRASETFYVTFEGNPVSINLGDDIDTTVYSVTNMKITYASHSDVKRIPLSTKTNMEKSTTYDKAATGSDAITDKTVTATYTDSGYSFSGSFNIHVNDWVTSIDVVSPTELTYNVGAKAFNFTSEHEYVRNWKSEAGSTEPTDITQAMCSVNGQPLTTNILNKIGTYTVSVTDADSGKSDSFTIKVVAAPQPDITTTTDNPVAVVEVEATFTDSTTGDPVSPSDIGLDITATDSANDASLTNALQQKLGSGMRDGVSTMHLTLEDSSGDAVNMSGKVRVRVPMPNNSQPGDTFVIAVRQPDGTITTIVPTKSGNELIFDLPANNVDIAISSKPNSGGTGGFHYYITYTYEDWLRDQERMNLMAPSSGLEPDVKQSGYQQYVNDVITAYGNQQDSFWDAVRKALNNSTPGTIIRANAKTFDQMPVDIMKLVSSKGQTLVVSWSWGKDITITPQNALTPEADRVYYPLSFLVTALSAATTTAAASVLLVPQTGDAIEVLSMTPAGCGMLEGAKPAIGNAVAALDIALDDSAAIAEFPYMAVCLTAFAAALLLAGLAVGKRRKKN